MEHGEKDIKNIGKAYRAEAFDRENASDVRSMLAAEAEMRAAEEAAARLKEDQDEEERSSGEASAARE